VYTVQSKQVHKQPNKPVFFWMQQSLQGGKDTRSADELMDAVAEVGTRETCTQENLDARLLLLFPI
jgi:hypothetical protein